MSKNKVRTMRVYDVRKVQKRTTTLRGKKYYTYFVNLPSEWVDEVGLRDGDLVEISGDEEKLCLKIVYRKEDRNIENKS